MSEPTNKVQRDLSEEVKWQATGSNHELPIHTTSPSDTDEEEDMDTI